MSERAPLTLDDFWSLRFITDMRLSPDGRAIAFAMQSADRAANETRSAIWLLDLGSGETRQLTSGEKRDASPRWSPDGRAIVFTSDREDETSQLYLLDLAGGEARRLTLTRRGAGEPFWSPDSAWIGFTSETRPGEQTLLERPRTAAAREQEKKDEADRPRIISRLQYRWDGKGYLEGRGKLFRVWLADGRCEQLTDGDYDDMQATCSPDGRSIAFVSDREDNRDANMTSDLWLLDLETHATRRLTDASHAFERPVWSPDGRQLACLATPRIRDHSYNNVAPMLVSIDGAASRNLFAGRDLSAEVGMYNDIPSPDSWAPAWSADGGAVYLLTQRRGGVDLLRVAADGSAIETVVMGDDAHIAQFALAPDAAHIYTVRCDPAHPWDIWEHPPVHAAARQLTWTNAATLASRALSQPERFEYDSFDGWRVEGWLYRPASAPEAGAPLALKIHGGPHGAYGQTFFHTVQALVGKGYAVLYVHPRGSTGYGEAFAQACDHDWGGGDYRDIMVGVDTALARGGLDGSRMAVFGGSYGGYMTNWIIGHTDRFRAAVTINSVTNLVTSFGTGDIDSVWAEGDYGWPWERADFYRERSPITYAPNVTTPTRIIAAENDYRCPIAQSEELYTWLRTLGRAPVDFVRMPGASHGVHATPRQHVRALELEHEWITRYCPVEPAGA
ncbi:MAG TPA: S9 family peptidase [Ktedonobacterales bacterium]|nr:S9 family peptidase [Ktedonobacterales bacterium]